MTSQSDHILTVERTIGAERAALWRCWTEGELLKQWFCPKPWTVAVADLDPRPGGRMNVTMAGPNGERMENEGCFLTVDQRDRLVFTDAFAEGYMPRPDPFVTSVVKMEDVPEGTRLVWSARHATAESKKRHEDMGFEAGWNAALDQLEELVRSLS